MKKTVAAAVLVCLGFTEASAQVGTAFSYQGRLTDASLPANGSYDLKFDLFSAATLGTQIGTTVTKAGVAVSAGLFTVTLDFGAPAFTAGAKRWLEVSVKPSAGSTYTVLSPRQELTPTPNALFAASIADGSVTTGKIAANGCATGQVLQFNGSAWVCATVGVQTGCSASDLLPCYTGPAGTLGIGICRSGLRSCDTLTSTFGACSGEVLPVAEVPNDGIDSDCAGPNFWFSSPFHLATGVASNTTVTVTFMDAMDPATITASTFTLTGPGGPVSGSVGYAGTVATFTPATVLAANSTYTATLSLAVKDPAGRSFPGPRSFAFTTAVGPSLAITQPVGLWHGTVPIVYSLAEAGSLPASIAVEFSVDGGANWSPATRVFSTSSGDLTTGLSTSPAGVSHAFFWDARANGVASSGLVSTVRIRMTPTTTATGGTGPSASTANFSVDNNLSQVIGTTTGLYVRNNTLERTTEAPIGNLVADAMRVASGTQLFMQNGGGLRSALPSLFVPSGPPLVRSPCSLAAPCHLVQEDTIQELPFGNEIVTMTVTGAQIWQALEHSVAVTPSANGRFLQISGFSFVYSVSAPAGARVQSVTLAGGAAILNNASTNYTLGLSDYTATGGDGYVAFTASSKTYTRKIQADALLAYIIAQGTLTPATSGRITQIP